MVFRFSRGRFVRRGFSRCCALGSRHDGLHLDFKTVGFRSLFSLQLLIHKHAETIVPIISEFCSAPHTTISLWFPVSNPDGSLSTPLRAAEALYDPAQSEAILLLTMKTSPGFVELWNFGDLMTIYRLFRVLRVLRLQGENNGEFINH